jgi:DNA-binding transcriptional LysR family regulator
MADKLNDRIIDSRRLFYFYHVAQAGSFSRAEAAVSAPQPIISRHISKLEEEIGLQLLDRHGRGVSLTQFGEILQRRAGVILTEMEEALDELDTANRQPLGQVSIAGSATIMSLYMPEIVTRFIAANPEIELTAVQASTGEVYSQLIAGKVDVGIVLEVPNKAKFEVEPLSQDGMVLVVARTHGLAAEETITRASLKDVDLVLPAASHGLRAIIDQYIAAGRLRTAPKLQIDSIPLIRAIVAKGRYATILPSSTAQFEFGGEFVALPIRPGLSRTIYAAYPRESRRIDLIDRMMVHIRAVFDEKPSGPADLSQVRAP